MLFVFVARGIAETAWSTTFTLEFKDEMVSNQTLASRFGFRPAHILISTGALGSAQVYEFSAVAPEGAGIVRAQLKLADRAEVRGEFTGPGAKDSVRMIAPQPPSQPAAVLLVLIALPAYLGGVLLTALFATVILTAGYFRLDSLAHASDGAVTVLLAGPGLFSALVARPEPGSFSNQLLVGSRLVLLLAGLLTFIAAFLLVAITCSGALHVGWAILVGLSWISTAALAVGFGLSVRRLL